MKNPLPCLEALFGFKAPKTIGAIRTIKNNRKIANEFPFLNNPIKEAIGIVSSLIVGFVVGGIFPGITHISAIFNRISRLLAFPFVGWAIWLWLIIGIPFLGGWLFMLVDLIKFLMLRKEEK